MRQKFDIKRIVDSYGATNGYAIVNSEGKRIEVVDSYDHAIIWIDAQPDIEE